MVAIKISCFHKFQFEIIYGYFCRNIFTMSVDCELMLRNSNRLSSVHITIDIMCWENGPYTQQYKITRFLLEQFRSNMSRSFHIWRFIDNFLEIMYDNSYEKLFYYSARR